MSATAMWCAALCHAEYILSPVLFVLAHLILCASQAYVRRVEELIGVPVRWVGNGPKRDDVIDH